jgi:plastocyanin
MVLAGCGGDDGGPGPSATPADVEISASSSGTINSLNTTRQLTATVRDANDNVINNATVSWSASPSGVVSLSSNSGLTTTLTAVGNGTATVTAQSGSVSATHQVTVTQDFAALVLTPNPGTVNVGSTLQLNAVGNDPGGSPLQAALTGLTFTSSDDTKASVNGSGVVSGHEVGDVIITAEATVGAVTRTGTANVSVTNVTFPNTADVTATTNQQFIPQNVDIAQGGTVTWTFQALGHNVTFGVQTGAPTNIGTTMNGTASRTFNTAGTFNYSCTIHPGMSGSVIVH